MNKVWAAALLLVYVMLPVVGNGAGLVAKCAPIDAPIDGTSVWCDGSKFINQEQSGICLQGTTKYVLDEIGNYSGYCFYDCASCRYLSGYRIERKSTTIFPGNCPGGITVSYNECEKIPVCDPPCEDGEWKESSVPGYQNRDVRECQYSVGTKTECVTVGQQWRCADGYYGSVSGGAPLGCHRCPTMGGKQAHSEPGNNATRSSCYYAGPDYGFKDNMGEYILLGNDKCYSGG